MMNEDRKKAEKTGELIAGLVKLAFWLGATVWMWRVALGAWGAL